MALKQTCMIGGLKEVKEIIHNNYVSPVDNPPSHDQVVTPQYPPQGLKASYAHMVQVPGPATSEDSSKRVLPTFYIW